MMLSDYQILAAQQIWPFLICPSFSAVVYWCFSRSVPAKQRLLISAHGWLLLAAFGYAILVSPYSTIQNWRTWIWPFWLLFAASFAAIIYTFEVYKGPKAVHWIHALVIPSGFLIWFVGTMTITHDWL